MGYQPVLGDSPSIAIPPGLSTIEACKWLVISSDIFVLIIGGRYGSVDEDTGKSITNIEYDTAFEAGMPIYIFVDSEVLSKESTYYKLREVIEKNGDAESKIKTALGNKIEDLRVFDFISRIKNASRDQWLHSFDSQKEIIDCLKNSWSLLFKKLLSDNEGSPVFGASLRVMPKPVLRFVNQSEDPIDSTNIAALPVIDEVQLLNNLAAIKPNAKELAFIDEHIDDIKKVIKNMPLSELGLTTKPSNIDVFVKSAHKFYEYVESLIDTVKTRKSYLRLNLELAKRVKNVKFDILNEGTCPAENIVIYLNPSENIYFVDEKELVERQIIIPNKINKSSEEILTIARNLEKLLGLLKAKELAKETPSSLGDLLLKVGSLSAGISGISGDSPGLFGSSAFSHQIPPNILDSIQPILPTVSSEISLENGSIRIDISHSLKHNFHISVKSDKIYIYGGLEKGDKVVLNYSCHADNLPSPTKGKLYLVAE